MSRPVLRPVTSAAFPGLSSSSRRAPAAAPMAEGVEAFGDYRLVEPLSAAVLSATVVG